MRQLLQKLSMAGHALASLVGLSQRTPSADSPLPVKRPATALGRVLVRVGSVLACLFLVGLGGYGLLLARLAQGPIALESFAPRIIDALQQRFGAGYKFELAGASLTRNEDGFSLALEGMSVRDSAGHLVLATPAAHLSVDPIALATGNLVPRRLDVRDADLRLSILPDGQLAISAGSIGESDIALAGAMPSLVAEEPNSTPVVNPASVPPDAKAPGYERASTTLLAFYTLATQSDGPVGALDRLGIKHARLTIEDKAAKRTTVFEGVDLAIDRLEGQVRLIADVDGPMGRWKAVLQAGQDAGAPRKLSILLKDLSLDDLILFSGQRQSAFVLDTPISLKFDAVFDDAGKLAQGGGQIALGAGLFKLPHPDSEPILIDELTGQLRLDASQHSILLENWQYFSSETHFIVDGAVFPPWQEQADWRFDMATRAGGSFGPERPGEKPISVDRINVSGAVSTDLLRVNVDNFKVNGPELNAELSAQSDMGPQPFLKLAGSVRATSMTAFVRLWPSHILASLRAWCLQRILAGTIDAATVALDFDAAALELANHEQAVPDDALHVEGTMSGASVSLMQGLPPLSGVSGTMRFSGHKSSVTARQGFVETSPGHRLELADGSFTVPETALKIAPANVSARLTGNLDTVSALLAHDSLKPFVSLPLNPELIKGQIDGKLSLDLKLGRPADANDSQVRLAATLTNFVAEKLVGKEKLDAATLALTFDRGTVKASGQGKMFGQAATIELKKAGAEAGEATIGLTIDEAARARLGLGGSGISGPIAAKVTSKLGNPEETRAQIELDLGKAGLDGLFPGFSKPAGKAAKASFQLSSDADGSNLDQLVFEGGGASVRGSVELRADGSFLGAKLTQVRLSPGDDFHADVTKTAEGIKMVVRGAALDARPFLQNLFNSAPDTGKDGQQKDQEIDIKVGQVLGQNRQTLTALDAKFARKGGQLRQLQLAGKLGGEAVAGVLSAPGQISVKSDNAGSFLSFIDLYRRMEGGDLALTLNLGTGRSDGSILIHDFLLRDEPALRRLVTEGANVRDNASLAEAKFDANLVEFQKLQVYFIRSGGRIDLKDGVMYGPQIGTTLEGTVDFPKNFIDVRGTFVPAYGLNNFFARIPILGPLLGGGAHEGLFAINFRVSGPASGPTLNINPLSAIAPGFLRKIFGAGDIPAGFQTKSGTQ